MYKEYVENVEGGAYRIAGSRVSLDSIVYGFWNGESPETIAQSFPTLKLEQVYGAIAFYLANQEEIDAYLKQGEAEYEAMRLAAREADPMFYQKLADAKQRSQTKIS
ncbi:MAG: DUF433 domain-containing protein [Acidobacteria bacterium]|nr:DUF433 domain-containing protein [Acidobacteriota bacterium]